jgi:hypothetical protein
MRGKHKRKKQRQKTLAHSQSSVTTGIDQKAAAEPESPADRQDEEEDSMSFIKLIKDDPRFRFEVIAVFVGIAVLVVYIFQLCATRESINNSVNQFQIDQRPYLWTTEAYPKIVIIGGKRVLANIPFANYGKSPALRTRVIGKIFIGPTAKEDAESWFLIFGGNKPITKRANSEVVVPPGIPTLYPQTERGAKDVPETSEPPRDPTDETSPGPEGGGFAGLDFTLASDKVLNQSDVDYILGTDESVVFVIHMQYFDGFGNFYWSDVCVSRLVSGGMAHCSQNNEIH